MTRKDYVAFAEALASVRPTIEQHTLHSVVGDNTMVNSVNFNEATKQWRRDRAAVAAVFIADNPRFDRERFYEATEK